MRDKVDYLSKVSLGTKLGTEYSLSPKEEYLGSVPESSEEQVQVQGGYASAPCNPVTLSFTLNLGAYKKRKGVHL